MTYYGLGATVRIPPSIMDKLHVFGGACRVLFTLGAGLVRAAILFLVHQLARQIWPSWIPYIMLALNSIYVFVAIAMIVFQCDPAKPMIRLLPSTKCLPVTYVATGVPAVNTILDFIVWLLPVYFVFKINTWGTKKKFQVSALLGFGLLGCIVSALRIDRNRFIYEGRDLLSNGIKLTIYSNLELFIGIVAANLPAIFTLLVTKTPYFRSRSNKWQSDQSGSSGQINSYHRKIRKDNDNLEVITETRSNKSSHGEFASHSTTELNHHGPSEMEEGRSQINGTHESK